MKVGDVALLHAAFQRVGVVGEAYAVLLDDIAGSAHGSGSVVAVLGNLVAGSRHHEASAGGDVEGVLSVAARTYNVDGASRGRSRWEGVSPSVLRGNR